MSPDRMLSILIVEDDAMIALDEAETIESFGYRVVGIADEACEALRLARETAPRLALVDVNLADGRTGPAICATLTETLGVPVIFVTGNPEQLPENLAGAIGWISKPCAAATLAATLDFAQHILIDGDDVEPPRGLRTHPRLAAGQSHSWEEALRENHAGL